MPINDYHRAKFLYSVGQIKQLPPDNCLEVAFAGRSNVGKSSTLNALTQQKKLAKTSKTPGRTQLINYFEIGDDAFLVDLPGYGFARADQKKQQQWGKLIEDYMHDRQSLQGIVHIMDIRHPVTPLDEIFLTWAESQTIPVHIVLNKSDKLSKNQQQGTLKKVENLIKNLNTEISIQSFSSLKKTGIEQLAAQLDRWFKL